MVGMQMASAYIGSTFFSPLFAFLAKLVGFGLYPYYLLAVLALMILMETGDLRRIFRRPSVRDRVAFGPGLG